MTNLEYIQKYSTNGCECCVYDDDENSLSPPFFITQTIEHQTVSIFFE